MSKKKEMRRVICWYDLVALMRGYTVILLGKDGEPDVSLVIADKPASNVEEAIQELEDIWENGP